MFRHMARNIHYMVSQTGYKFHCIDFSQKVQLASFLTRLTRDELIAIPQPYQIDLLKIDALWDLGAAESLDLG